MLKSIQQRDLQKNRWIKITMTAILLLICGSMLFYLIPGLTNATSSDTSPDSVAVVGGQPITVVEVQQQINQMERNGPVPAMMRSIYSRQIIDQLIFQQALYLEADRLGIRVTPQELTERIKQFLPDAWAGGVWQKDRYATLVQSRTGMPVSQFESILRDGMLTEKFRHLVGDGIIVSPAEIEQEFRRRNEKVSIEYALVKPSDLMSSIHPTDADLAAYFAKNSYKYQIPEKRSARYALLDLAALRAHTQVSDAALQTYYNEHINDYKVENRVHVEQILFKTVGKTDAEIAEIKKKADDVDKQAKKGSNFEDLAKKNSEDESSKAKGGDIGWIGQGQTVAEFEKVAFSLPKGGVSDPVQTQYGIQIIKVLDHETAHTKPFDEVRASILPIVLEDQVNRSANSLIDQIAFSVRQSDRQPIDALAKKFNLELGETPAATATEPLGDLGNSEDLHTDLFQLNVGELSQPVRVDRGFVVLSVKDIQRAHQASIAEVHDAVVADYQQQQSADLASSKAAELAKAAQGGEDFAKAAKRLGFDVKISAPFAVTGSVPDVGTGQQLAGSFGMSVGQVSAPKQMGTNWLVYRVATHDAANPDEIEKQKSDIEQQILQTKQNDAFGAFKSALEERLAKEGKLVINKEVEDRLTKAS
jgi:peptidyl-prolyl cis-trans isomerase D